MVNLEEERCAGERESDYWFVSRNDCMDGRLEVWREVVNHATQRVDMLVCMFVQYDGAMDGVREGELV